MFNTANNWYVDSKIRTVIGLYNLKNQLGISRPKNIAIFASPRGGSTWLSEILCELPNSFSVFEPLNPNYHEELKPLKLARYHYLSEDENHTALYKLFNGLFNGTLPWKSYYFDNRVKQILNSKYLVHKFCFGNMLLPWIVKHFDIKPLLFIRHPCGVVSSQLKHPQFQEIENNENFIIPVEQFPQFYTPYKELIKSLETREEILAAIWAFGIKNTLYHPDNNKKWLSIFYENLLLETENELNKIQNWLSVRLPEDILEKTKKSSRTTIASATSNEKLSTWKKHLSEEQVERILHVVTEIGVDVYSKDFIPN